MKIGFTKIPRHRTFQHDPIYFDEAKEERAARERKAKEELGLLAEQEKTEGYSDRIRGGMRRRVKSQFEVSRSAKRKSNLRLVIILIILAVLASYLLRSGQPWMDQFIGN